VLVIVAGAVVASIAVVAALVLACDSKSSV
jgi:hypothetical protein